jgi:hypothetical protein
MMTSDDSGTVGGGLAAVGLYLQALFLLQLERHLLLPSSHNLKLAVR